MYKRQICGVCPVPHTIASSEAIEDAIGLKPPRDGRILREIMGLGAQLHDHPLHNLLMLPDYVDNEGKRVEAIKRIQTIRKVGQLIVDVTGGEGIHPPNTRIGGMVKNITEHARDRLLRELKGIEEVVKEHIDFMVNAFESAADEKVPSDLGKHSKKPLATDETYGNREKLDPSKIEEMAPEFHYGEVLEACNRPPKYDGDFVEVGPRARAEVFRGYKKKGTIAQQIARTEETLLQYERVIELLEELNTDAKTLEKPVYRDGSGFGVYEAPRGTDLHMAKVGEDGRIKWYNLIVPTTWNMPTIGYATEGFHYKYAELVVRGYDPCLSCATHLIVLRDEERVYESYF